MKNGSGDYINTWSLSVQKLLNELGYSYLFTLDVVSQVQVDSVVRRIYDVNLQDWCDSINSSPKLDSYKIFKTEFVLEKYLLCIKNNNNNRIMMTRFRCSAHTLLIEEGRYRNIERENRICTKCNMNCVENEYHFLLICPFYRDLRISHLPKYYTRWPCLAKFATLLSTTNVNVINKIATYLYKAFKRRE